MTQVMDFRSRTRAVREAARRQLYKLREERLAQRGPRPPDAALSPPPSEPATLSEGEVRADSGRQLTSDPVTDQSVAENPVAEDPVGQDPVGQEAVGQEAVGQEAVGQDPVGQTLALGAEPLPEPEASIVVEPPAAKPVAITGAPPSPKRKPAPRKAGKSARAPAASTEYPDERAIRQAALAEMFADDLAVPPPAPAAESPPPLARAPAALLPEALPAGQADVPAKARVMAEADQIAAAPSLTAEGFDVQPQAAVVLPMSATAPPPISATPIAQAVTPDLAGLPGAGPGLIWMLGRCGITSLGALAASDPQKLSADLGLVGQILDVTVWRDYAARQVETLSRAS